MTTIPITIQGRDNQSDGLVIAIDRTKLDEDWYSM